MTENCFWKFVTDNWFSNWGDASLIFPNGSCLMSMYAVWNRKLMKIWSGKITHENLNWMKNWLSIDLTLKNFSKTNSSSWLRIFSHLSSKYMFDVECAIFYIKQPKYHIDQDSKENGRIRWTTENPFLENFSGVTSLSLALREDKESQWIMEV